MLGETAGNFVITSFAFICFSLSSWSRKEQTPDPICGVMVILRAAKQFFCFQVCHSNMPNMPKHLMMTSDIPFFFLNSIFMTDKL